MNKRFFPAMAKAFAVLLAALTITACQIDDWDGDADGAKDDIGFFWPNEATTVSLECLSATGKQSIPMERRPDPIITKDNHKVFLNQVLNFKSRLNSAGCYQKGKLINTVVNPTETIRTYEKLSRFRFRDGNNVLYIFSPEEGACFKDNQQHPDLVQRAVDCNTNTANDQMGLTYNIGTIEERERTARTVAFRFDDLSGGWRCQGYIDVTGDANGRQVFNYVTESVVFPDVKIGTQRITYTPPPNPDPMCYRTSTGPSHKVHVFVDGIYIGWINILPYVVGDQWQELTLR